LVCPGRSTGFGQNRKLNQREEQRDNKRRAGGAGGGTGGGAGGAGSREKREGMGQETKTMASSCLGFWKIARGAARGAARRLQGGCKRVARRLQEVEASSWGRNCTTKMRNKTHESTVRGGRKGQS